MARRQRKPNPAFMSAAAASSGATISESLLRQARKSGHLNLSSRQLKDIPKTVWRINLDPPADNGSVSFGGSSGDDRWWEQTDLIKLILAGNLLSSLSEDICYLPALTILDAHDNQITSIPDSIGTLQNLNRLILSRNNLATLPHELCSLSSLSLLKLDYNKLTQLPDEFGKLVKLEELDISHNALINLPESIGELTCLSRLTASHNQLKKLPDTIGTMAVLKDLILNNNKLTTLPLMSGTPSLLVLALQYNCLTEFPTIEHGSKLKELQLGANRLSKLDPDKLVSLTSLLYLDLRENRLQSIPVEVTRLEALERLDVSNNDLPGLPNEMGNMPNIKSLLLDGNPLKTLRRDIVQKGTSEILKYMRGRIETPMDHPPHVTTKHTPSRTPPPPRIAHKTATSTSATSTAGSTGGVRDSGGGTVTVDITPDTRKLDLCHGNFTSLPDSFFSHDQLTEVAAGYNKLTLIPPAIGQLTRLSVLDVRNNRLTTLPSELVQCVELRDLILSFNQFTIIPVVVYQLKKLEHIIADDNQITSIDVDGLCQLPMIQTIDLQNNSITQVPPQLGNIATLKHLQLGGNMFRHPRPAVLARGTAELLQFLRGRIPA